jgi:hypothetical protein
MQPTHVKRGKEEERDGKARILGTERDGTEACRRQKVPSSLPRGITL